ncbi:MAG: T9SS type A sorting domain-containing protein [Bacteroidia bacterium]|nr:T9SS type A sorting domain-containing protein [Bacteroidia bacterium]
MNRDLLLVTLFLSVIFIRAQAPTYLIGSKWNGSVEQSMHMNTSTGSFTTLSTLTGVGTFAQGETAYDPIGKRYFNITNLGLTVIDALTGLVTSVVSTTVPLKRIEYNTNTGKLIGSYANGANEMFASLDITTGAVANIALLNGLTGFAPGETAFDAVGNRYFNKTNGPKINVIDVSTGAILNSFSTNLKGIEYNSNTGKINGSYWNGSAEIFGALDLSNGVVTNIGALTGVQTLVQGETAFDASGNRYFNKTNLGITVVNALNGSIVNSFTATNSVKGIEYVGDLNTSCSFTMGYTSGPHIWTSQGSNVSIIVNTNASAATYLWQSNAANLGWINIPPSVNYSINGATLTINNVSVQNHLQKFKVTVTSGTCIANSDYFTLHVSDTCTYIDTIITGLSKQAKELVNIYPNPVDQYLVIENKNLDGDHSVTITNNLGQIVHTQSVNEKQTRITLDHYSTGVYILQLKNEQNQVVETKKIVIR